MSPFAKIAWRNILRNKNHSRVTAGAIAASLCALILLKSFVDGADHQMVENYTDLLVGSIQVHKTGFQKNMGLEKSIVSADAVTSVFKKIPGIAASAPRVKDFALISSSEGSAGIILYGVDPVREKNVSVLHKRLTQGKFLKKDENAKIVIGKALAENLKVGLGDKVVLMSQASDASIAASAFEVYGILKTGTDEIDKNIALITLKAAQELLVMGSKVSEIVVKIDPREDIDSIVEEIKGRTDPKRFEVLTWKEISPLTYQWLRFDQMLIDLILVICLMIVAGGILNTLLMGVLEKTREFGIMLALGTQPSKIAGVVALEAFFLGLIGVGAGTLIGASLVATFNIHGINLSAILGILNNLPIGSVIYPRLDFAVILSYAGVMLLTSMLASVIPARHASRLVPAEAIRHL
jgi:ABC-type lipoprotein release transport system permease subunit